MDLKLDVLRSEVKQYRQESPRLLKRILALIELTKFRDKYGRVTESDYERLAVRLEISGRTLYRWEAAYREGGPKALSPGKAAGDQPLRFVDTLPRRSVRCANFTTGELK